MTAKAIAIAIRLLWPSYDARDIPALAVRVATPDVSAPLLVAIAYHESRFDSHAVSRVKRRNGSTALFCGITQATARSEAECEMLRDDALALLRTVEELRTWRRFCRRLGRDTLECALAGYAEGVAGARRGTNANARLKLRTMRRIER